MRPATRYDATNGDGSEFGLLFNRMSPSAYLRGRGHSILYTLNYLAHLEQLGVRVVNGLRVSRRDVEGAAASLLKSLGPAVSGRSVINHPAQAPAAATGRAFRSLSRPTSAAAAPGSSASIDWRISLARWTKIGSISGSIRRRSSRSSSPRGAGTSRASRCLTAGISTRSRSTARGRASTCARRTSASRRRRARSRRVPGGPPKNSLRVEGTTRRMR